MRSFIFRAVLFLCSCSWISVSGSEFQTVEVQLGEEVTLQCSNISGRATQTDWFKVVNRTKPSCVSSMFGSQGQVSFCDGFQNEKFNMSSDDISVFLQIKQVDLSDAGLYYCGFYMDRHTVISNSVELTFIGDFKTEGKPCENTNVVTVILASLAVFFMMVTGGLAVKIMHRRTVQGCGEDGAYPSCHRIRGGVHPGQVATPSQGLVFTPMNVTSVDQNSATVKLLAKTMRSRRPAAEREVETHIVYVASR